MAEIEIEYCAPCRFGAEAVVTRRTLSDRLREYREIDTVAVEPIDEDVLRVTVDGDRVWSVDPENQFDPIEAVAAVRSRLRS